MPVTVSGLPPLRGTVVPPGDCRSTLSALAFACFAREPVTVLNPAPSLAVAAFRAFLEAHGAVTEDLPEGFRIVPPVAPVRLRVDRRVPDEVLHILAGGALAGGGMDIPGDENRAWVVERVRDLAVSAGLPAAGIAETGDGWTVFGGNGPLPARPDPDTDAAFEMAAAYGMASGEPFDCSCNTAAVSHIAALIRGCGWECRRIDDGAANSELERRRRKADGLPPVEPVRLEPAAGAVPLRMPGDTALAAALAVAASVIGGSDLLIRGVLYEPGRRGFFDCLRRMKGAVAVKRVEDARFEAADLRVAWAPLTGIHCTVEQARTLRGELPLLAAAAAFAGGETVIPDALPGIGCGRAALSLLARGLEAMGARAGDYAEGIVVRGGLELRGAEVDAAGHGGLALAFVAAGWNAGGATTIVGAEADVWPVAPLLAMVETAVSGDGR